MSHTPGPWKVGENQKIITQGWSIRIHDNSAIAYVIGEKNPEMKNNACLIAAAPEMYEAIRGLLEFDAPDYLPTRLWDAARAAIMKAEGRTK